MSRLPTNEMTDEAIVEMAIYLYADDDIDIDTDHDELPAISRGENGAWVQAWVWVHDD